MELKRDELHYWKIQSETNPEQIYTVSRWLNCWHCTCPARTFHGHECKHIKRCKSAISIVQTETIEIEK